MREFRSLADVDVARRVLVPLFARLNPGDVTIRHHWTGDQFKLHSFRHRGYWFHGKRREADVLSMLQRLIRPGDHVLDVGGHIGYLSVFFASLVGPGGRVEVFEPGINNLPYLLENTRHLGHVEVHRQAVSSTSGNGTFFMDDLTGQNNSLGSQYSGLSANASSAHVKVHVSEVDVEVTTLDLTSTSAAPVDLVKIDIEGGELQALIGAAELLSRDRPALMVEVSSDPAQVVALLHDHGYQLVTPAGSLISGLDLSINVFALHKVRHARVLHGLLR